MRITHGQVFGTDEDTVRQLFLECLLLSLQILSVTDLLVASWHDAGDPCYRGTLAPLSPSFI